MLGDNKRRAFHLFVLAILTVSTLVVGPFLTSLTGQQSWWSRGAWIVAGIIIYFLYLWWQARSQAGSLDAIKEQVSQLEPELRKQVQARSYGARSKLIEAPLRELALDITPRVGWVRDPRLVEPEPLSERIVDDVVAAFESSKRRMLIVGEPGSGKTIAAYSLIEYLDNTERSERVPLLVNLSAWEAQDDFETFLVDYLCSSVGYEVHERAVARTFIDSDRYSLIFDGVDEIPVGLRQHFSERLDGFMRGVPSEVGVVVTCRTQEYEELLAAHPTGLGLVQAVEILPLSSEQLDSAFVELAKLDKDWEIFLAERHLATHQQARDVLSNPLFLNLAVAGRRHPRQLLECDNEQEFRALVLDSYIERTLADQEQYEPEDARRYLTWIARFLNGAEVSPFGLRTSDYTVFDLADLTPPDPPRRYRMFVGLVCGLTFGLGWGLIEGFAGMSMVRSSDWLVLVVGLIFGLGAGSILGLVGVLVFGLLGWPFKRSAVSPRLTLVWPLTRQPLVGFLRRAGRGMVVGLWVALVLGLILGVVFGLAEGVVGNVYQGRFASPPPGLGLGRRLVEGVVFGLVVAGPELVLILAPGFGLGFGLGSGLLETQFVLIASRTPKEASSRSLTAALTWLVSGLVVGLVEGLVFSYTLVQPAPRTPEFEYGLVAALVRGLLGWGLTFGLGWGLILGLRHGGWFVVLQKIAHRRLARAGNLPPRPYHFLEWGIDRQIFRRVGGGVRFHHYLVQQHLANASESVS